MLFPGGAVPDICCLLSSSPQQDICIIIISPRPSRKLSGCARSADRHPPVLHCVLFHIDHPRVHSFLSLLSEKARKEGRRNCFRQFRRRGRRATGDTRDFSSSRRNEWTTRMLEIYFRQTSRVELITGVDSTFFSLPVRRESGGLRITRALIDKSKDREASKRDASKRVFRRRRRRLCRAVLIESVYKSHGHPSLPDSGYSVYVTAHTFLTRYGARSLTPLPFPPPPSPREQYRGAIVKVRFHLKARTRDQGIYPRPAGKIARALRRISYKSSILGSWKVMKDLRELQKRSTMPETERVSAGYYL